MAAPTGNHREYSQSVGNCPPRGQGTMSDNTTAWKTPRQLAEDRVANMLGTFMPDTAREIDEARAEAIVAAVFDQLREPDRAMLEAGRRELALAVPPATKAYVRNLAAAVWRTMFAEAR